MLCCLSGCCCVNGRENRPKEFKEGLLYRGTIPRIKYHGFIHFFFAFSAGCRIVGRIHLTRAYSSRTTYNVNDPMIHAPPLLAAASLPRVLLLRTAVLLLIVLLLKLHGHLKILGPILSWVNLTYVQQHHQVSGTFLKAEEVEDPVEKELKPKKSSSPTHTSAVAGVAVTTTARNAVRRIHSESYILLYFRTAPTRVFLGKLTCK